MNVIQSNTHNAKTDADRSAKILRMKAAAAFKNGDFSDMLAFDQEAEAKRRSLHNRFFENSLKSVNGTATQTVYAAPTVQANATGRRVFRVAR